ncbi:MAG: MFS transporter, partial [Clostridia bacterium]|nr:MFS transporter [Clostridia bacterium]
MEEETKGAPETFVSAEANGSPEKDLPRKNLSETAKTGKKKNGIWYLVFLCWFVYTMAYCGRYSYTANIGSIGEYYAVSNGTAGLVSTFFFFVYGAGQIVNGLLCKRYNKRYVIGGALLITAISNGVLTLDIPFSCFKWIWLLNGAAQSFLWSSIMLIIGENVPLEKLRVAGLVMSTTVAVGKFLSYGAASLFIRVGNFKWSFAFGGIVILIAAILWFATYAKATSGKKQTQKSTGETTKTEKRRVSAVILASVVLLGVLAVVVNLVLDGFMTWMPSILKGYGVDGGVSVALGMLLPVFGVIGSFGVTYLNKLVPSYVTL